MFCSRAALGLENLALRHQIGLLQRSASKRPKFLRGPLLWICLSRLWCNWRSALAIVKPETVVAWHRAGFRLLWTGAARSARTTRHFPRGPRPDPQDLPGESYWGAPRIHGELLKLGIDIGESSVSKYMVRCSRPPSQTWRTCESVHRRISFARLGQSLKLLEACGPVGGMTSPMDCTEFSVGTIYLSGRAIACRSNFGRKLIR